MANNRWANDFISLYEKEWGSWVNEPRTLAAVKMYKNAGLSPEDAITSLRDAGGPSDRILDKAKEQVQQTPDRTSARDHMVNNMRNESKELARIRRLAGIKLTENQDSTTLVADAMARYIMGDSDSAIAQLQRLTRGGLGFGELSDNPEMYNAVYQEVFQSFKDAIDGAVNYQSLMGGEPQYEDVANIPLPPEDDRSWDI